MTNVTELPVGEFDAVRTLRNALALAEKGEFKHVIILTASDSDEIMDEQIMEPHWSRMSRKDVLWMTRWFNSYVNYRYFGAWHDDD